LFAVGLLIGAVGTAVVALAVVRWRSWRRTQVG